jgi:FixJ family two-component response regulator
LSENPLISIIDDDLSVREATMNLVRTMGFATAAFESAEHFLESDGPHRTSCLIADMRMPGISGLELHARLLASGTPIPTILMTAFADERDRMRAMKAGVVSYLAKPFTETELFACLNSALKIPVMTERAMTGWTETNVLRPETPSANCNVIFQSVGISHKKSWEG